MNNSAILRMFFQIENKFCDDLNMFWDVHETSNTSRTWKNKNYAPKTLNRTQNLEQELHELIELRFESAARVSYAKRIFCSYIY